MDKDKKVFFLPNSEKYFVKNDLDLLKQKFQVRTIDFVFSKKEIARSIISFIRLVKNVYWADITFSWFASTHAFFLVLFSRLFRKKSVVIVGGYEVAKLSKFDYGLLLNRFSAFQVKYVLKNAHKVIAVSEFIKGEIAKLTPRLDVQLLYNGIKVLKNGASKCNRDSVLTVAYMNRCSIKLKGLDTFIRSAEFFPLNNFIIVGPALDDSIETLKRFASRNVKFIDYQPSEKLAELYRQAKVYCQLSYRESFGLALAESMSFGCVPVVTSKGAMPEIVGDTGFYVPYGDLKITVDTIKKALVSDKGKKARLRIKSKFDVKERNKKLLRVLNSFIEK